MRTAEFNYWLLLSFTNQSKNWKSDDDNAVYKLCGQRYKVQTVKLTL